MKHARASVAITALAAGFLAGTPATAETAEKCKGAAIPDKVEGTAFSIDGDTLKIFGVGPSIRIWGIQAPELRDKVTGQESIAGMRARARLEELIGQRDDRAVVCTPTKFDRYCRLVALCTSAHSSIPGAAFDIGLEMVESGHAYGYWLDDPAPGQPRLGMSYAKAEAAARQERFGQWPAWLGKATP